jgi:hypothetical protein
MASFYFAVPTTPLLWSTFFTSIVFASIKAILKCCKHQVGEGGAATYGSEVMLWLIEQFDTTYTEDSNLWDPRAYYQHQGQSLSLSLCLALNLFLSFFNKFSLLPWLLWLKLRIDCAFKSLLIAAGSIQSPK